MYEIYLEDIKADGLNPPRVAELLTVGDDPETGLAVLDTNADALELCNAVCIMLQPFLREGIEAHFVSTED
jgi:hypothetical protein